MKNQNQIEEFTEKDQPTKKKSPVWMIVVGIVLLIAGSQISVLCKEGELASLPYALLLGFSQLLLFSGIVFIVIFIVVYRQLNPSEDQVAKCRLLLEEVTKELKIDSNSFLLIDDKSKKWLFKAGKKANAEIYNFSDILDFELEEDGDIIVIESIVPTLLGGLFFGEEGAFVGSLAGRSALPVCKEMEIHVRMRSIDKPLLTIQLIKSSTHKASSVYKKAVQLAQETCACLGYMSESSKRAIADLRKYKKLKDDGVISQEEFEAKKKQLLKND